jgi:hypothetical protein
MLCVDSILEARAIAARLCSIVLTRVPGLDVHTLSVVVVDCGDRGCA